MTWTAAVAFTVTCSAWSRYREFGPPDDPGLVFFLGQGFLEVSGHPAGPPGRSVMIWIQVRDVHAGHARLAAAGVPVVREPVAACRGAPPERAGPPPARSAANPCVFGTGWSCMVMQAR